MPVSLIVCYLSLRHKLGHNSDKDLLFPNTKANFNKSLNIHYIVILEPIESMTYNNYRGGLKNIWMTRREGIWEFQFLITLHILSGEEG